MRKLHPLLLILIVGCSDTKEPTSPKAPAVDATLAAEGQDIFRFDTFGDESFWTDQLRLHEVIQQSVDPTTALSVGLKVDADALTPDVVSGIEDGSISLTERATTLALLQLDAVVGVKGTVEMVDDEQVLTSVGITCALCHSTVDDSFAPGIGKRLDGWPNRDLDPGAIIALSAQVPDDAKAVYGSWGPGKIRSAFQPRRQKWTAGHSAGVRLAGSSAHHLDRRWRRNSVLESLRRGHTNGRARLVRGASHGCRRHQW